MLKELKIKSLIASALIVSLIVTVFTPVCSAEEVTSTMPNLSEYSFITIDEIEPETTVGEIIADTVLSEKEEVNIYNFQGFLLSSNDYVGNASTIVISNANTIAEVYKTEIYGDIDCNGEINALDLTELQKILLGVVSPVDDSVSDVLADGQNNVLDFIRLKKHHTGITEINQCRQFAYSARFNWLDNIKTPFSIMGYEETFEDFSIVSKDIDLTFNRYYNSNNISNNILGAGWTASFEGSCTAYGNNSKIVKIYGQTPIIFNFINGAYVCEYSRATLNVSDNGFVFIGEDGLSYTFNSNGYLTAISDNNNNTVTVTLDTNGKILKVTDSVDREYNYTYGINGLLSSITDCIGRTVSYNYNPSNNLISVTGVLGTVTEQYEYNSNNKLTNVSDAFGNRIIGISYQDNSGTISSVTDSESVTTDYVYNEDYNSVTLLQENAVIEEYTYNRYNFLTTSTTEDGIQQNFYCNAYGDIAITKNADGSKAFYGYDTNGNPTKITTVSEEETVTEINKYDSSNNLLSTITGDESTSYTYDEKGNILTVIKVISGEETENFSYVYNDKGLVLCSTIDGVSTTYTYDNYGYLSSESNSEDDSVKSYSYNIIGWLESETSEDTTINYKYNLNGDTLRESKNNVVKSRTVYDNYGRIKQQINQTEYDAQYDGLNTVPQADVYLNNSEEVAVGVRYYYGEDGKLSQIKASCYTVDTDSNQKVTGVTAGETVLAQYNYAEDAKELLSSVEYANGQGITYNYDVDGNIISLYYGDTLAYSYTYDTEGTLTSKLNIIENIRTDYTEDSITVSRVNEDNTLTEIYSYNSEMLIKADLPAGTMVEEFYPATKDDEADLQRITENFNGKSFSADYYENLVKYGNLTYSISKTDDNTVSGTKYKNGMWEILSTDYTYNEDNLPAVLKNTYGWYVTDYNYTYDENGNITDISKNTDYKILDNQLPSDDIFDNVEFGSYDKKYYYDNLGQLIRVDDEEANTTTEYLYNGTSGNITAVKTYALHEKDAELGTPTSIKNFSYAESGWTDLLTSVNGNALTYDDLGNLLTYNGYTYTWEAGRRLSSMSNGTNTYSYKYDDNGIRTQKTVNGVTTYYTTVDGRITGQYDGTNTIYFRYNADNSLIGFNLNGTEYIYLKNLQGDIEGILDLSGNLVVKYTYDAWGKLLSVTDTSDINLGTLNPMRYRGYYYDNETEYYYLQSRYYNSEFCRFINADEPYLIGTSGNIIGYNLFGYCENNSLNYIDPTGHWVISVGIEGQAAFILGVYIGFAINIDQNWDIAISYSAGFAIITNAAADIQGYVAFYPKLRNISNLKGWGVSVGASFSMGVHVSGSGSIDCGFSGGVSSSISIGYGAGVSIAPIPYFQTRIGYTGILYKFNLLKTLKTWKNNTQKSIKVLTTSISITKLSSYVKIYFKPLKKNIYIYKNKKVKIK